MILVCIYQFIYKLQFYINNKYKNGDFIEDIILKAVLSFKNSIELKIPNSNRHFLFKQKLG